MDGGGSTQQRCFCLAKTCRQQMYRDVHLLTRYLHRLFLKVLETQKRYGCGWFCTGSGLNCAKSQLNNVHGRIFFNVLAGAFYTLLVSASFISKKQTANLFSKVFLLFSPNSVYFVSKNNPIKNLYSKLSVIAASIRGIVTYYPLPITNYFQEVFWWIRTNWSSRPFKTERLPETRVYR